MSRGRDLDKRLPTSAESGPRRRLTTCIHPGIHGRAGYGSVAIHRHTIPGPGRVFIRQGRASFHFLFWWCCASSLIRNSLDREGRVRSWIEVLSSRRRDTGFGSNGEGGVSAGIFRVGSDMRCRNDDAVLLERALQVEDVFGRF